MNILLFLIPVSLVMIGAAALVFAWAVRHGQFEDLDTPALDILRDDDARPANRQAATPEPPADDPDAD
jgi:cbb3-type cytochrome oxidase maturation protein